MSADDLVLVDPWWDLRSGGSDEERKSTQLLDELRREVAAGHPLHEVPVDVIGACRARDDVLLSVGDRFAIVHLTYEADESPPWPSTRFFDSAADVEDEMRRRDG